MCFWRPCPGERACRSSIVTSDIWTLNEGWSGCRDLNPGPRGPEPRALPDCATARRDKDTVNVFSIQCPTQTCKRQDKLAGEICQEFYFQLSALIDRQNV